MNAAVLGFRCLDCSVGARFRDEMEKHMDSDAHVSTIHDRLLTSARTATRVSQGLAEDAETLTKQLREFEAAHKLPEAALVEKEAAPPDVAAVADAAEALEAKP